MSKLTRADLEQQGFNVFEVGDEEEEVQPGPVQYHTEEAGTIRDESLQRYTERERQFDSRYRVGGQKQSRADEDAQLLLKVATLALKVLSLRVLLYGAGTVSSVLFYQVVQSPNVMKIVSAVLFTVLVFIPTLYYSSKSK